MSTFTSVSVTAGVPKPDHLEGRPFLPLLKDHRRLAILPFSYGPYNTAAQSDRYRYIRYEDGSEELYDHQKDPHEWINLIGNKKYQTMRKNMRDRVLRLSSE